MKKYAIHLIKPIENLVDQAKKFSPQSIFYEKYKYFLIKFSLKNIFHYKLFFYLARHDP